MGGPRRVQAYYLAGLALVLVVGIVSVIIAIAPRKPVAPPPTEPVLAKNSAEPPKNTPAPVAPTPDTAKAKPTATATATEPDKSIGQTKSAIPLPRRDARPPDDGRRRLWAIVIGIDAYNDNESIPPCRGAENAAQSFATWLKRDAAWEEDNVLQLSDRGQRTAGDPSQVTKPLYPSKSNLEWAFSKWLPARIRSKDLVVVFYAGQAIALPPPAGSVPGAAGRGMLLAIDSTGVSADLTGFALENAIEDVARTGLNPVLCLLDTSLHGRGTVVKSKLAMAKPDTGGFLRTLTRWPGVSAWIAASDRPSLQAKTTSELSPFASVLIDSMGTRDEPYNLLASLSRMQRDARSTAQGFKALGNLDLELNLWSTALRLGKARQAEMVMQRGHALSVQHLVFQPDSTEVITASDDSSVKIWRTGDRTLLRVLDGHIRGVTALALADGGGFLASGDAKSNVQIWDFQKRAYVPRDLLPAHRGPIADLGFIPQSNRLISRDDSMTTWMTSLSDFNTGRKRISDQARAIAIASAFGKIAFAIVDQNGRVIRYERDGTPRAEPIEGVGKEVESALLATDGTLLVVANRQGEIHLWDEASGRTLERKKIADRIERVAIQNNRLAIASGSNLLIFAIKDGKLQSPSSFQLTHDITNIALSNTGRFLGARTNGATFRAWQLDDGGAHTPVELKGEQGLVTCAGFSPDEQTLVLGNQDGSVRFWDLPSREPKSPVLGRRGQITSLSVSGDGRFLLQVNKDRVAQLWDLFDSREVIVIPSPEMAGIPVPGGWLSGAITRDGKSLVMSTADRGDIVILDRQSVKPRSPVMPASNPFPRPMDANRPNETFNGRFEKIRILEGPGRKLIAASGDTGNLLCLWDYLTGALLYTVRCEDEITSYDITPDANVLATADKDGALQVWDLTKPNAGSPQQPKQLARFTLTTEGNFPTAVRFLPSADAKSPLRIVSGARDGEIAVWQVGQEKPLAILVANGPQVNCLTLTADQTRLAAGFRDKTLRHWRVQPGLSPRPFLEPSPNHQEEINVLIDWPGRPVVASGSDDTTIRLWNLDAQHLEGTLSAGGGSSDWVAYAPNGRFDCAVGAERQLSWLQNDEVIPIEQFGERIRLPGLLGLISKGEKIDDPVILKAERPRLAIDPPVAIKAESGDAHLAIRLSAPGLSDLRLYQDGIPIRNAADFELDPDGKSGKIKVRLHNGTNKFYAMAGLPGTIDGRSNQVELRYDEPDPPGELHVLALGVGEYDKENRRLKFAKSDAIDIAAFLHDRGVRGSKGLSIVLKDTEVDEATVTLRLRELRNRVRDRPQDTVAVFLAGHTDMVGTRFSLLLPQFKFPDDPNALAQQGTFIEFNTIYRYVTFLGCQNRLMIVDACRSGEILNDPRVQAIRRDLDSDAHQGKTSYILAARPGGVAGEAEALKHGLLTYSLLKGMGAPGLADTSFTDVFKQYPTADRDKNKVVTADELRWYADLTVPQLSRDVPLLVQRSGVSRESAPNRVVNTQTTQTTPEPPTPSAIPLVPVP